jgi:hypothetical protein
METVPRHCSSCGEERDFEAPPCADGHGCDCPELVCRTCGAALVTDLPPVSLELPSVVHHAA